MEIDNTKMLAIVVFILCALEIFQNYLNTGLIDFGDKNTLANGIIALLSVVLGYTHHTEKKEALHTPVPEDGQSN